MKTVIKIFSVILLCLVVLLGYFMPELTISHLTDEKSVSLYELPDVTLETKEKLSYEEKFLLANDADNVFRIRAKESTHSKNEIREYLEDIIAGCFKSVFSRPYSEYYYDYGEIAPFVCMDSEEKRGVFWYSVINMEGFVVTLFIDDETLSLLSFEIFYKDMDYIGAGENEYADIMTNVFKYNLNFIEYFSKRLGGDVSLVTNTVSPDYDSMLAGCSYDFMIMSSDKEIGVCECGLNYVVIHPINGAGYTKDEEDEIF